MSRAEIHTDLQERRLSAILAADVVGYSRLMGVDEEGTLEALKAHRKALVDPAISDHRGRHGVAEPTGASDHQLYRHGHDAVMSLVLTTGSID